LIYVLIGVSGYLVILLFDIMLLKKIGRIKFLLWMLGSGLMVYSITMVCLNSDRISMPSWTTWLGWVMFGTGVIFITYSLFINLPFRKTYVSKDTGSTLIRTGFYALCRHPGTYWVNLFMISFIFISKSRLTLVEAPVFIMVNTILVIIEDRYIFPKLFPDYAEYQRETPMLIPNRKSVHTYLESLKRKASI